MAAARSGPLEDPVSSAQAQPPVVELIGITKSYPGVLANDNVSFDVRHGEVHCLLGENGAGKSTLMGILSGITKPDSGAIRIEGKEVAIGSPRDSLRLGIGTVYQHSTLIGVLTVLENLMLGENRDLRLKARAARNRLHEIASMLGIEVDPSAKAADLALGRQQQVEIIKALWRGSRVLILDEPTSMLTPQAVEELSRVLERLKSEGLACVFITHKLYEAAALADRISILRQGRVVGTLDSSTVNTTPPDELQETIVEMMFGRLDESLAGAAELKIDARVAEKQAVEEGEDGSPRRQAVGEPLLELDRIYASAAGTERGIEDVSLTVHENEVLGIAGVDGNGQRALAEAISGQRRIKRGEINLFGARIGHMSVTQREKLGLRYLTDDRIGEGLIAGMSIAMNLVLKRIGTAPYWRHGRIRKDAINERAAELMKVFDVRAPSVETHAGTLSGGNMQKVLLARELSFGAKVVVFYKPTYGLDLKTTKSVHQMIREMGDGKAAVVISPDLDELLELCDRVVVLSGGTIVGETEPGLGAAERIGAMMIGEAPVVTSGAMEESQ